MSLLSYIPLLVAISDLIACISLMIYFIMSKEVQDDLNYLIEFLIEEPNEDTVM